MKFLKNLGFIGIINIVCAIISLLIVIPVFKSRELLYVDDVLQLSKVLNWCIYILVVLVIASFIFFSSRFFSGKPQEVIYFMASTFIMSMLSGYVVYCLFRVKFEFARLDWFGYLTKVIEFKDFAFYAFVILIFIGFTIIYGTFIDRRLFNFFRTGLRGKGKLKQVEANLENSRWMTNEERNQIFKVHKYSKLGSIKKDGIPVMAKLTYKNKDMDVAFNSPCHSIIIGSTGSGKTTTFVSPMIQILGTSGAGSSMIVTDPKGELFGLHSKYLFDRGYDVKVIDLRDTYESSRWNPLDPIWDNYQSYLFCHKTDAFAHTGDIKESDLQLVGPAEAFEEKWYEFHGKAYPNYDKLIEAIKIYKKKTFDEVYEDLNDLCSVLIPVENEKDPMWEKGARSIVLATCLAMLEDAGDPRLNITKDKFCFFNLAKILQNSNKDYEELRNYFKGRKPLSKALALSKQVCDAATQTRASYMSIVYEKLTMFNDSGICALTSASDFNSEDLAHKPTALFLKIPDEKDTRHNLAAIFILTIYKTLIKVASSVPELTLERNVYFIMDEFGNMPKIDKFDKFITVGRSRKIWFNMIVQSYAQLNNVYGETVADIVKGNCGIKMFIGSNDMGTCKEYSELCGNITVVTTSTSGSAQSKDVNVSSQTQVRPLIYPSELQRLNHPGDIGHSIIVTFGNYPFKTYFSPSFLVPFYKMGKMDTSGNQERYFDENQIVYSVEKRNQIIFTPPENTEPKQEGGVQVTNTETGTNSMDLKNNKEWMEAAKKMQEERRKALETAENKENKQENESNDSDDAVNSLLNELEKSNALTLGETHIEEGEDTNADSNDSSINNNDDDSNNNENGDNIVENNSLNNEESNDESESENLENSEDSMIEEKISEENDDSTDESSTDENENDDSINESDKDENENNEKEENE